MKTRKLGNQGLMVSEMGLGCMIKQFQRQFSPFKQPRLWAQSMADENELALHHKNLEEIKHWNSVHFRSMQRN